MDSEKVWRLFKTQGGWRRDASEYAGWKAALESGFGAVFPRIEGREVSLYLVAETPSRLRSLRDVARQALGDVWLDLRRRCDPVRRPSDRFDEELRSAGVGAAVRVWAAEEHFSVLMQALDSLGKSVSQRPRVDKVERRGIGLVLREFQASIERGDLVRGERLLVEMREFGLVESNNLAFLRLWGIAKADPEALLKTSGVSGAIGHRCPPLGLLRTVARSVIALAEDREDSAEWLGKLWSSLGGFGESLRGLSGDLGAAMRMLASAVNVSSDVTPEDFERVNSIELIPRAYVDAARENSVDVEEDDRHEQAAFILGEELSEEGVGRLLQQALSDASAVVALEDMCSTVSEATLAEWQKSYPLLRRFKSIAIDSPNEESVATPASYLEWLRYVKAAHKVVIPQFAWEEIPLVINESDPEEWVELAGLLDQLTYESIPEIVDELPAIIASWARSSSCRHSRLLVRPMLGLAWTHYLESAEALASRDAITDLYSLLEIALSLGLAQEEYGDTLGFFASAVSESSTVGVLPGAIEILELLLDSKCPEPDALNELMLEVASAAAKFTARINEESRWLLQCLLRERKFDAEAQALNSQVAVAEETVGSGSTPRQQVLHGVRIGIYSLEVGSMHRARDYFQQEHGVEAVTNSDHVSTEALENMCRSCDYVVMVKRAAQHAATDAIRRLVDKERLVMPIGKGASSIVRDTLAHIRANRDHFADES